ncbi:MAG: hypothetical protein FK733_04700 [Asgard group archaeon]|nr:hypothetical protein [Asgard group archaeon]
MVSDAAFYSVIGVLGLVVVLFIAFFFYVKSMMPGKLMGSILTTLHASLFGYEKALIEMIGPRGYRTHVFPEIVNTMREMQDKSPLLVELFESKEIEEALNKWLQILNETKIIKNGIIVQQDDGSYEIVLPHCMMCDPIHEMIGDQKGICPMALILTAAGSIADNSKEPQIGYSTFTKTGTITNVKFD